MGVLQFGYLLLIKFKMCLKPNSSFVYITIYIHDLITKILPFSSFRTRRQISVAFMLRNLSDSEILLSCSTSPSAEGPDFVENQRRYSKLSAIIGV